MLIHHFLERSAASFPGKTALVQGGLRATYGDINACANRMAHALTVRGVVKGDRVVLVMENCLEYVIAYYGALKAGGVAVPLNTDFTPESVAALLGELEPAALIASSRFEPLLEAGGASSLPLKALIVRDPGRPWEEAPFPLLSFRDVVGAGDSSDPAVAVDEGSPANIVYTSGSTGKNKGVVLTHGNIAANTRSICTYLELTDKDIQMVILPFYYVMGKSLLNTHFAAGGTVVLNNQFAFTAAVLRQMAEEKVTGFSGVPSTFAYLLHRSPLKKYRDRLPALRYCSQAGGHMPRRIKEELREALPPHTEIFVMYGATEASARLTYLEPGRFAEKMNSIGRAIPGVTVRVLGEGGEELGPGQTGELVASGENIMAGYWKDPEATARVLDDKGYHTGDMGYRDDEGYFYTVGRKDNLLKSGGHRINPQEVEDAIMDTGLAVETAVLGVPDRLLGQSLAALTVPKDEYLDPGEIVDRCARILPRYKLPSRIHLVKALPKKSSGKIDRNLCMELLQRAGKDSST